MGDQTLGRQTNTRIARLFRDIVTAGWANLTDGEVEAPTGHFAVVSIEPAERAELVAAVWDTDEDRAEAEKLIYPGDYMVFEDSDGNTELIEYLSLAAAMGVFNQFQRDYNLWWSPTCPKCGEEGTTHERWHFPKDNRHKCAACGHVWDPTGEVEADGSKVSEGTGEASEGIEGEVEILPGWRPQVVHELEDEPEGWGECLYLVCGDCGEAFSTIEDAYGHGDGSDEVEYSIKPESEAM